ncbi:conserved hypothetical protein [Coccidioides posadasii str. Silveira]|uniref:DUF6594 domain-containing protein n=1 Tax=Coccidioides posadasii (strain RMSCC 757 / Silveira) TaxID=443226 RepID=E9CYY0_COCPS|nr:conserved hypothetical protein [Coccidioides posadasii str. Silveira]
MSHVKNSKRRASKKSFSPFANPVAAVANVAVARPIDEILEPSSRPRSQSTSHRPREKEILPGRRRATTRSTEPTSVERAPDVFQFLDNEDSEPSGKALKCVERRYSEQGPASRPPEQDCSRKDSTAYSFRSDSGISVRDHSPGRASSTVSGDEYQPPTPPDIPLDNMKWGLVRPLKSKRPGPMAGAYITDTESLLENPVTSSSFMDPSAPESNQHARRRSLSVSSPKSSPPEKPTPESRPRIYRKFDALNHRLLRHLQEEIIQLEEDLSTLDELEAAHQSPASARNSPRQKLLAAKYHDLQIQDYSVLHYKRTDLLEKVALKTEQYIVQTLPPPSEDDIETYRNSLSTSQSTTKGDRRILDHKSDLVLVAPRPMNSSTTILQHPNPIYTTIAAICAAILFPLLAFGAINEFFGRIVIVAIIGGMIALWASNGPGGHEYFIDPQDGWKCAVLYFGFMSIAAMIIS